MKAEADRDDQAETAEEPDGIRGWLRGCRGGRGDAGRERKRRSDSELMEAVVERGNMWLAYQRVVENKGAAGVDGLTVAEFKDIPARRTGRAIRAALLAGEYQPQPVRRVDIPKPQGGVRTLGIPTVVDRLIQQALHQVLQPIFEPTFSEASYGFRPGTECASGGTPSARVRRRRPALGGGHGLGEVLRPGQPRHADGASWRRKIGDARVLKLIRRYLEAGMMADGMVQPRTEGTPQGGPLSPLLSNILLTSWTRNWSDGATRSAATPTTATSSRAAQRRASG